jgi:hypothetical protein
MSGLLAPLLAQAISLVLEDRSEVRTRLFDETFNHDAETRPGATLSLTTPRTAWSLAYAPTITALSLGDPEFEVVVFHNAQASGSIRFRRTFVSIAQKGTYGERNFRLTLAPQVPAPAPPEEEPSPEPAPEPSPTPEPAPAPEPPAPSVGQQGVANQVVRYGSAETSLFVGHVITRRVGLGEFAGYSVSGGLDASSRQAYPLQRVVSAGVALGYVASRRDTFWTSVDGGRVYTDPDAQATLLNAREVWSRTLSPRLSLGVGAGVSYGRSEAPDVNESESIVPTAAATLSYSVARTGARMSFQASAGATSQVDRFTGVIDPRAFWSLTFSRTRHNLTWRAGASGTRSLDPDSLSTLTSVSVSAGVALQVDAQLSVDAGVSGSWQSFGEAEPPPILWSALIGMTYRAPTIDL